MLGWREPMMLNRNRLEGTAKSAESVWLPEQWYIGNSNLIYLNPDCPAGAVGAIVDSEHAKRAFMASAACPQSASKKTAAAV